MKDEQGLLFLKKKKQKDFFILGHGSPKLPTPIEQNFLRRFFSKKRLLDFSYI
jgi:hypothetical protein